MKTVVSIKKAVFLLWIFQYIGMSSFAQTKMKDLFEGKTSLSFFGYDFTQARFIGSTSFTDAGGLKDYFIPEWNKLIFLEPKKYALQSPLRLKPGKYSSNTEVLESLNKTIDMKGRIIDVPYTITEEQARKSIEQYKPEIKEGIGCSFVIESMDRSEAQVTAWVVFFDLSSMQVILIEKMVGKTGGIGLRNYYASGFANITSKMGGKFKDWVAAGK